jgi:hypothetical protein
MDKTGQSRRGETCIALPRKKKNEERKEKKKKTTPILLVLVVAQPLPLSTGLLLAQLAAQLQLEKPRRGRFRQLWYHTEVLAFRGRWVGDTVTMASLGHLGDPHIYVMPVAAYGAILW